MQDKPLRAVCFADELLLTATEDDQIRIYQMENDQMKLVQTIVMDGIEEINSFYMTEKNEFFVCSDTGVAILQPDGTYETLSIIC